MRLDPIVRERPLEDNLYLELGYVSRLGGAVLLTYSYEPRLRKQFAVTRDHRSLRLSSFAAEAIDASAFYQHRLNSAFLLDSSN